MLGGLKVSFASLEVRAIEGWQTPADRVLVVKPHRLDVRPKDNVGGIWVCVDSVKADRHGLGTRHIRLHTLRGQRWRAGGWRARRRGRLVARPAVSITRGAPIGFLNRNDVELPHAIFQLCG